MRLTWVLTLLACVGLAGCQFGPRSLVVASSHYSDAVRVANSEQLLVNLVRLRYRDTPVFLGVTSISTQFEFEANASVGGEFGDSDTGTLGAGVRYSERPTLTFGILGGETFQKRMLEPVSTPAIALLAESGWREDRVLRVCAEQINGLKNAPTASGPTPQREPAYREFREVSRLIRKLTLARLIEFEFETRRENLSAPLAASAVDGDHTVAAVKAGVEFERTDAGELVLVAEKRVLTLRFSRASDASPDTARLRELLKLRPGQRRFDLVREEESGFDVFEPDHPLAEVGVDARSLIGILYFLSNGVEVPQEHLDAGVAIQTTDLADQPFDWGEVLDGLFEVRVSPERPERAAVAVRHRGHWFYVDDADTSSKATFLLLGDLFSIQAGDVEETKPVLTLPVGGR